MQTSDYQVTSIQTRNRKCRKQEMEKKIKENHQTKMSETQEIRNNEDTEQPESKRKNGSTEFSPIINQPKCRWTEFTNQEIDWVDGV